MMRRRRSALPLLALVSLLWACGDEGTGPGSVASVAITPSSLTLRVGQATALSATALAQDGSVVPDRVATWVVASPAVASVAADGVVTGLSEGSTSLTASIDGVSASAALTVLPPAAGAVELSPAQLSLLPGDTVRLTATVRDGGGNVLAGHAVEWLTDDLTVADVDAAGLVTAVAPGQATVYAKAGERSASVPVGVDDPNAARVTGVTPAEIVEGAAAAITGANFSTVPAENVVTVDGVRATVTGATATTLDIVVPSLDCRPRHMAEIGVTVNGHTARFSHPAGPAAYFTLAQGAFTLLQDPSAYCLQFDSLAADEEYLVGVQSVAENPASLTYVRVEGEADANATPVSAAAQVSPAPSPAAALDAETLRDLEWRGREAVYMEREIESARLLRDLLPATGPLLAGPARLSGTETLGDTVVLKYPELDGNTCSEFVEVTGTVRYIGTHSIWVGDVDNPSPDPNLVYDAADYVALGDQFENEIYPVQTGYFGFPADADANGRIVVVVTKEVNADGIGGIVPSANLFSQAQCAGSNEGEYFFMFAPDPNGEYDSGAFDRSAALRISPPIIGHEFVHNIHVSRRWANGLALWDSWMHEGQATFGEEVLGHALTTRSPGQNYGWSVASSLSSPDQIRWYLDSFRHLFYYYGWNGEGSLTAGGGLKLANAPEGCSWLDTPGGTNAGLCARRHLLVYGVSWSFLRWITDHYAADFTGGEPEMHTAWIDGSLGGLGSLEALVGVPFEELLAHWAATLYLDDRAPVAQAGLDPLLTLPSWNLNDIEANVVPEAHLTPRIQSFGTFAQTVQIRGGSTAYFTVSGADRASTALRARSTSGGLLAPSIQMWVARIR